MDGSEKIFLLGIGGVLGGVLLILGIVTNILPKDRVKRARVISVVSILAGIIAIFVGRN